MHRRHLKEEKGRYKHNLAINKELREDVDMHVCPELDEPEDASVFVL